MRIGYRETSEFRSFLVASVVVALAFALLYSDGVIGLFRNPRTFVEVFPLVGSIAVVSFLGHELAHRLVANKLGYYARFQHNPQGLALALATGATGLFLFIAPGAVVVYGFVRERDSYYISLAGPLFNILLGSLGLAMGFFYLTRVNAWLALINLLPIGGLDGRTVARRPLLWVAMFAWALVLLFI